MTDWLDLFDSSEEESENCEVSNDEEHLSQYVFHRRTTKKNNSEFHEEKVRKKRDNQRVVNVTRHSTQDYNERVMKPYGMFFMMSSFGMIV